MGLDTRLGEGGGHIALEARIGVSQIYLWYSTYAMVFFGLPSTTLYALFIQVTTSIPYF